MRSLPRLGHLGGPRRAAGERGARLEQATPEDIAEAVLWLIEGARTMTGELLMLDSGVHLGARVNVPGKS